MSNNMSISSIKEHYNNLCTKAKEWSAAYYEQDAPVVTDEEYDSVMHEIRDIEAAHPEFVTADSPTQVVGGKRVLGIPVEVSPRRRAISLQVKLPVPSSIRRTLWVCLF